MKDMPAMFAAMKKEIALRKNYLQAAGTPNAKISLETLYFGGGTPSVLSVDELSGLMDAVNSCYSLVPEAEITLEANPDDLTDHYLDNLRQLGFNRLSIGIQSFFDDDLKWMNRRHNSHEAVQSVELARRHGFNNLNIDLIYGLPGMTLNKWRNNLEQAFALDVQHLSAYHLTIEPRTVFGRRQTKGTDFTVQEDDSVRQFYMLLDATEQAGYEHYEISNFARDGFRSRHNSGYWQQKPYIGIGPAAHSFDGLSRQWNVNNNSRYIELLSRNDEEWFEREQLSPAGKYNDYILTSLRTAWGVDAAHIQQSFGNGFLHLFQRQTDGYIRNGFIQKQGGHMFVLTRKGQMIADRIAVDLFCDEEEIM
jgi:oxygen-independent coproporphyrinogen-3 oxidase